MAFAEGPGPIDFAGSHDVPLHWPVKQLEDLSLGCHKTLGAPDADDSDVIAIEAADDAEWRPNELA